MENIHDFINNYTVTTFINSKEGKQLSTKRVLYHIGDRLKKYDLSKNKIVQGAQPPISVALCPTSKCIRKCAFCSNTERNEKNRKIGAQYSEKVFNDIMSDLNSLGVLGVSVAGGGEPLCYNKSLFEKFTCQNEVSYKIGIHTNGVLVNNLLKDKIIEANNINYINISVVAHNSNLYKIVTGGSEKQFQEIEKNIINAVKLKEKYDVYPNFGVKILLCRDNYKYVKEMYDYFLNLGVTNILLRCVGNFEENQDVELLPEQINELKDILVEELNLESAQIDAIIGKNKIKVPVPSRCWIATLNYTAGIDPDGEVYLCSPWSRKEYSIGNVNQNRFSDVWGGEQHFEVIEKLNTKLKNGECNPLTCRHYYSNLAIDAFINGTLHELPKEDIEKGFGRFI